MNDLQKVAQALRLDTDSPIEKVLDALANVVKRAGEADFWETEAKDNLEKMEKTDRLFRENSVLRVESFYATAVLEDRIDKAEADEMKKQQLAGQLTEDAAKAIIAVRRKRDYNMRKSSLASKPEPGDPIAEVTSRANELIAKSGGKMSKADAMIQVKASDPELSARYDAVVIKGAGGDD